MLLEPIYEQDFSDCSFGFRPGRSPHQALTNLQRQAMDNKGGWIVELDIRKFFDMIDHSHLRKFLKLRVCDGVVLRLIGKGLKAGVLENGNQSYPNTGSPQGGVVSPLLANVYLHYVLDKWFEEEIKQSLKGQSFLIRFADDAVLGFVFQADAIRVIEALPERFGKFGLSLHPDKTKMFPFQRPLLRKRPPKNGSSGKPGSFDFLGFTHFWGRSLKGHWVIKRKTASDRLSRSLQKINKWCRSNRHKPIKEQHHKLCQKMRGHYAYYGITGNSKCLASFSYWTLLIWRKWLSRRSHKGRYSWTRFKRLLNHYPLPLPVVVHSIYRTVAKP